MLLRTARDRFHWCGNTSGYKFSSKDNTRAVLGLNYMVKKLNMHPKINKQRVAQKQFA